MYFFTIDMKNNLTNLQIAQDGELSDSPICRQTLLYCLFVAPVSICSSLLTSSSLSTSSLQPVASLSTFCSSTSMFCSINETQNFEHFFQKIISFNHLSIYILIWKYLISKKSTKNSIFHSCFSWYFFKKSY